jgi:hypothetical protein
VKRGEREHEKERRKGSECLFGTKRKALLDDEQIRNERERERKCVCLGKRG